MKDDIKIILFASLGLAAMFAWTARGEKETKRSYSKDDPLDYFAVIEGSPSDLTGSPLMQWRMEQLGFEWTKEGRQKYRDYGREARHLRDGGM